MPSAWLSLLTMTGCERGRNKWFAPKVTLEDADSAPQPTVALRAPGGSRHGSSELQSRAARRGNPARDKAETALRATEKTLISAEETANTAVETREQCREVARLARERLRTAESAYVQGCRTLEQLASDFSEMRYEVEVALARAEAELVSANEAANAALRGMKTAEETADALLLVLRQAEMDHESAVHRLARMLSQNDGSSRSGHDAEPPARRLLFNVNADQTVQPGGSHGHSPVRAPRPALQSNASASEARRELAACGVVLESCVSESVADALLQVVHRQKAAPSSPNRATPGGAGVGVASNAPVRLMGFGQSCVLGHGGDSEEACFTAPTETPAMLQTMRSCEAVALACSSHHALVVTNPQRRGGGEVLAWGEDSGGRLGSGGEAVYPALHVAVPQRVAGLSGVLVSLVACSPLHSLALSIDGELFAWGSAANGLLGLAPDVVAKLPTDPATQNPYSSRAVKVEGFNGPLIRYRVRDVACGPTFNVACTSCGLSYSWGSAWAGCLGLGDSYGGKDRAARVAPTPVQIEALRGQKLVQVACGQSHVLAVTDSSTVWAWGSAEFGKLGLGDVSHLPTDADGLIHAPVPQRLEDFHRKHIVQLAAGTTHSLAVTRDGVVFSWGSSEYGKLGHGPLPELDEEGALMSTHTSRWWPFCPTPMEVNGLRGRPIAKVACGEFHSLAATIDGEVLSWGLSRNGLLGIDLQMGVAGGDTPVFLHPGLSSGADGEVLQANLPVAVDDLPWGHVEISTCASYSLLLYSALDAPDGSAMPSVGSGGGSLVPEVVGHLEAMLESAELADVVLVTAEGIEVQAHAVVLLAVPYLSDAIRELRHKRLDDSELMTIAVPELRADAVRAALRFAYSGTFEMPDEVHQTVHLLQCAAAFQMVPLIRACARTLEGMLAPECVAEVWEASDVHDLDRLKTKCLRFIIDHYDLCRPEKEPSIREAMRKHPAFFDLIMSALAPGPAASSRATKFN